jgi:DNA-binding CsgD family transcriptional regulator
MSRGRTALDGLSPREVEILSLTASGGTVQVTADALCLSPKTVHNTLSVIRGKPGARTEVHLVWIAGGAGRGSSRRRRAGVPRGDPVPVTGEDHRQDADRSVTSPQQGAANISSNFRRFGTGLRMVASSSPIDGATYHSIQDRF